MVRNRITSRALTSLAAFVFMSKCSDIYYNNFLLGCNRIFCYDTGHKVDICPKPCFLWPLASINEECKIQAVAVNTELPCQQKLLENAAIFLLSSLKSWSKFIHLGLVIFLQCVVDDTLINKYVLSTLVQMSHSLFRKLPLVKLCKETCQVTVSSRVLSELQI